MDVVSSDDLIRRIQRAYPQIWYHCHTKHTGRADELSDRESVVLGHLSRDQARAPGPLAKHMGIGASTLSEAIDKLAHRGFVVGQLDAAGLAATSDLNLRLDDDRVPDPIGDGHSSVDVAGRFAVGDGNAVRGEELLALIFE